MPDGDLLRFVVSCDPHGFDRAKPGKVLALDQYPLTRKALEESRAIAIGSADDARLTEAEREAMVRWGYASFLDVPMQLSGEDVALIELWDIVPRDFSPVIAMLDDARDVLAGAFSKVALLDRLEHGNRELRRQNRRLTALLDAGRAITSTLVVEDVLHTLTRKTAEAVGAPECLIYEFDLGEETMTIRSDYVVPRCSVTPPVAEGTTYRTADCPRDLEILLGGVPVQEHLSDADLAPDSRDSMLAYGEKSVLSVPFAYGDEPLGSLVIVETARERRFTAEEVELVSGIGEQAAAALHNAKLYRELERRQRETELLNEIARRVTSTLRVEDIAETTVAELHRLVPFDRASLVLTDERGLFVNVLSSDDTRRYRGLGGAAIDERFVARLERERVVRLELPAAAPLPADDPIIGGVRSGAVAGLFVDGELIGALCLGAVRAHGFTDHHVDVLSRVATHLALALGNARLYENIRRLHLNNLKALSSALSAKDYYTLGHAARVAAYMVLLGKELGWSHDTLVQAEEAAYLHDIGKIAISDRVLLKPSRLNTREWELMRQHPSFSADFIGTLFAPELVAAVRHHHERWDGGGYPDGLTGDDIPAIAQAMCIVDSYDAMSSWRPYRGALSYGDCLNELERCRGQQFDPRLVEAFRKVLEGIAAMHRRAGEIATEAAVRIDVPQHARVVASGDEDSSDYRAIAKVLREVRDANPPARYLTTIVGGEDGLTIVVDGEEEPAQHSPLGEPVLIDDELQTVFNGRRFDINVVFVDEWGAWVSGIAPLRDEKGDIVAVVNADLPADPSIRLEGLRGSLSETFAALVHSAALRFSRAEVDAITDGLTGIYNHRHLHERLAEELESAAERQAELTLLFCDLDHFKEFNDHHGHSAGDDALRGVAQIVESSIRHVDVAARYGGEEFAVILVDTGAVAGLRVAERIRRRVMRERHAGGGHLSISIGMATWPSDADGIEQLLEHADAAMYQAKRLGRNRVVSCSGSTVPDAAEDGNGHGPAGAHVTELGVARERLAASRADLVAFVAAEVATRLGLSAAAVAEVGAVARRRAFADGSVTHQDGVPQQVAGELGDRIVAAVLATGDLLGDPAAAIDPARFVARLRQAAHAPLEPDVLDALTAVVFATPLAPIRPA